MPQVQVIDTTERQPDPTGLEQFFSRLGKDYKDREDRVELGHLLDQYQKNRENVNAYEDLQLGLERSNISPSKRHQTQQSLNDMKRTIIERDKVLNAKAALEANKTVKKTQASQPIDPDQLARIQMVRKSPEFEKASPARKYQLMTDHGVSKENAEAESKIFADEEKNKPGGKFAEGREKSISEYTTNAFQQGQDAEEMKFTIDSARKAINGDVAGPGFEAVAKNNPYAQLFLGLTKDEALLQASNKKLLEGTKGIFGSKPTEREIFLLLNSLLPSIGKTKEANEESLGFIEKVNDFKLLHAEIVDEITEGGTKYVPDLERQVNIATKPYADKLRDELREAAKKQEVQEKKQNAGKVRVKAPDGKIGYMTQEQIENAKRKNVIFTPTE